MKKLINIVFIICIASLMQGCLRMATGGVEQYIINKQICTAVWYGETIVWSRYRDIPTSKDTLSKDSIDAAKIYASIKDLK